MKNGIQRCQLEVQSLLFIRVVMPESDKAHSFLHFFPLLMLESEKAHSFLHFSLNFHFLSSPYLLSGGRAAGGVDLWLG